MWSMPHAFCPVWVFLGCYHLVCDGHRIQFQYMVLPLSLFSYSVQTVSPRSFMPATICLPRPSPWIPALFLFLIPLPSFSWFFRTEFLSVPLVVLELTLQTQRAVCLCPQSGYYAQQILALPDPATYIWWYNTPLCLDIIQILFKNLKCVFNSLHTYTGI